MDKQKPLHAKEPPVNVVDSSRFLFTCGLPADEEAALMQAWIEFQIDAESMRKTR